MSSSTPRTVKISETERGGWSSDRPRRPGEPERPPRPVDVSVRGRVLAPSDRMRYSPGSAVLIVCPHEPTRERFAARVIEERGVLFSMAKIRTMLAGRVAEEEIEEKTAALLDKAVEQRLSAGQTVVIALEGMDPAEREHYVRMAHAHRRPRHFVLVEPDRTKVAEEDRATLTELRNALEAGGMGEEGFATSLRVGGRAAEELKKIVFAPPPADD
jgi:hypothetical protein